jgi:hypothetical protein
MNQKCKEALDDFIDHVNWNNPHPLDWRRFFDFVAIAHRLPRSRPWGGEIEEYMLEKHPNVENIRRFVYFYEHALDMLKYLNVSMARPGPDRYARREDRPK